MPKGHNPLDRCQFLDTLSRLKPADDVLASLGWNTNKLHKKYMQAASCLLANVWLMSAREDCHYLAISQRPDNYTRNRYQSEGIGYRPLVQKVLPDFLSRGLLKKVRGFIERDELGFGTGRISRFEPSTVLLATLQEHQITVEDVDFGNPEVIRLRGPKPRRAYRRENEAKPSGSLINYQDTEQTNRMRKVLLGYNEYVSTFQIEFPEDLEPANRTGTRFHRVFNEDFDHGGRLVGHWIQGISSKNRQHLRLNGEEVTELDFSNMNVHLLYSQIDQCWDQGDAYDLQDSIASPISRELGKYGFLIAMNISNRRGFGRALKEQIRRRGYPERQINGKYGFNSMRVLEALERKHSRVKHLFFDPKRGLRCMQMESSIMQKVLSVLDEVHGAPALPMHDGVIVRKSDQDAARETMWLAYKGAGHTSRPEIKIEF